MQTIPQIIDAFGGPSALAHEMGYPVATVSAWKHRGKIPARHWPDLVALARDKRIKGLSLETFFKVRHDEVTAERRSGEDRRKAVRA